MLSLLKKLFVVVVGVVLALLLTLLLVDPRGTAAIANAIDDISIGIRVALAALLDLLILLVIFALVRESRPRQRATDGGLVVKAQGAVADVSVASVRDLVLKAIRDVPNVKSVEAQVASVRGKADIELDVVVFGDKIVLPDKQKEIDRALRQVVNKQLGLQMAGKPRVHIQLDDRLEDEPSLLLGDTLTPSTAAQSSVIVTPPRTPVQTAEPEPSAMFMRSRREEPTPVTPVEATPVEAVPVEAVPVEAPPVDVTPPAVPELERVEPAPSEPPIDEAALPPSPPDAEAWVSAQPDDSPDEQPEDRKTI